MLLAPPELVPHRKVWALGGFGMRLPTTMLLGLDQGYDNAFWDAHEAAFGQTIPIVSSAADLSCDEILKIVAAKNVLEAQERERLRAGNVTLRKIAHTLTRLKQRR